jgi:hypothetical protein
MQRTLIHLRLSFWTCPLSDVYVQYTTFRMLLLIPSLNECNIFKPLFSCQLDGGQLLDRCFGATGVSYVRPLTDDGKTHVSERSCVYQI